MCFQKITNNPLQVGFVEISQGRCQGPNFLKEFKVNQNWNFHCDLWGEGCGGKTGISTVIWGWGGGGEVKPKSFL